MNECRHLYARLIKYLLKYHENYFFDLLNQNGVNISWINFYDIDYEADNTTEMFEYKKNKIESEKFYYDVAIMTIQAMIFFVALVSIISWLIMKNKRVIPENIKIQKKTNLIDNKSADNEDKPENYLIKKEKNCDLAWFKIFSSFDFIKNISLLNKKKEPLSDQTSLMELSTLKILILFNILMGENCYIILKYIKSKLSILPFFREISFIFIKIGMNSYESYKVICGNEFL